MFQPVKNQKIYMSVIEQVRGAIADGTLSPGDRLPPERELAGMFSVSRASVRQAISALEALGIVEIRHGDGTYVAETTSRDDFVESFSRFLAEQQMTPAEILETRLAVEPGIAEVCARRTDAPAVARLRELAACERAALGDRRELARLNRSIHRELAVATGNPGLLQAMDMILEMMKVNMWPRIKGRTYDHAGRMEEHMRQHEAIIEAVARGDGDGARRAMADHLSTIDREVEADLATPVKSEQQAAPRERLRQTTAREE